MTVLNSIQPSVKQLSEYFQNLNFNAHIPFHTLKLPHNRTITGPFVWYGLSVIEDHAFHMEVFEKADVKAFLSNAFDLQFQDKKGKRKRIIESLVEKGLLHKMDSGGFQLMKAKISGKNLPSQFNQDLVFKIQEEYDPDVMVQLDVPLSPNLSEPEKAKCNAKSFENFLHLSNLVKESSTHSTIMPVIHGHSPEMLENGIRRLEEYFGDIPFIGIGSLVPMVKSIKGTNKIGGKWTFIDNLLYLRHRLPNTFIHAFGIGGTMQYLAFYCGIDSIDSNGWIQKSGYGVIQLPGISDRFMRRKAHNRPFLQNHRQYKRNGKVIFKNEIDELLKCSCPICSNRVLSENKDIRFRQLQQIFEEDKTLGRKNRSIHNIYVQNAELKLIDSCRSPEELYRLIKRRLITSNYFSLLEYAKSIKEGEFTKALRIKIGKIPTKIQKFQDLRDYKEKK